MFETSVMKLPPSEGNTTENHERKGNTMKKNENFHVK